MKTAIALLAASLSLAACSGAKDPEPPVAETNVIDITEPANMAPVATEAPPAVRIDNTAAAEAPPADVLSADEQTQEDADATGMTARVNRDEGGNTAQPAE